MNLKVEAAKRTVLILLGATIASSVLMAALKFFPIVVMWALIAGAFGCLIYVAYKSTLMELETKERLKAIESRRQRIDDALKELETHG